MHVLALYHFETEMHAVEERSRAPASSGCEIIVRIR